jgi:hypothetical protein
MHAVLLVTPDSVERTCAWSCAAVKQFIWVWTIPMDFWTNSLAGKKSSPKKGKWPIKGKPTGSGHTGPQL